MALKPVTEEVIDDLGGRGSLRFNQVDMTIIGVGGVVVNVNNGSGVVF